MVRTSERYTSFCYAFLLHFFLQDVVLSSVSLSGTIIPAAMMVGMGFLECNHAIPAISMLVIGQAFCGFQYSGHVVNHLDIAPR